MDWGAPPPWNIQKNITGKNNYIESTNRIYMDPIIFHLIMSIAFAKKYDIIQVVHKDVQ